MSQVARLCPCHGESMYQRPKGNQQCRVKRRESIRRHQATERGAGRAVVGIGGKPIVDVTPTVGRPRPTPANCFVESRSARPATTMKELQRSLGLDPLA